MKKHITEMLDGIDAAVFNGDSFYDQNNAAELREYIDRWAKWLDDNGNSPRPAGGDLTFDRAIKIARGCSDYGGGYREADKLGIFQHGVDTVVSALVNAKRNLGKEDQQTKALEEIGGNLESPPKLTDEHILEIAECFGEFRYGDSQGHRRIAFAREIEACVISNCRQVKEPNEFVPPIEYKFTVALPKFGMEIPGFECYRVTFEGGKAHVRKGSERIQLRSPHAEYFEREVDAMVWAKVLDTISTKLPQRSEVKELTKDIVQWADSVFPDRKPASALLKLFEETGELVKDPSAAHEYADICIMIFDLANMHNVDLVKAIREKLDILKSRNWKITSTGTLQHVEDEVENG